MAGIGIMSDIYKKQHELHEERFRPRAPRPSPRQILPGMNIDGPIRAGERSLGIEFERERSEIATDYPRIHQYLKDIKVQRGKVSKFGGGIEFFPSDERDNPNPGKDTIEIYNKELKGRALTDAIAGDTLHLMGKRDPNIIEFRNKFRDTLNQQQLNVDWFEYSDAVKNRGETQSFSDWMDRSRLDAYLRGYLFPDRMDEWRRQKVYTPEQVELLENIKQYLKSSDY